MNLALLSDNKIFLFYIKNDFISLYGTRLVSAFIPKSVFLDLLTKKIVNFNVHTTPKRKVVLIETG